MSGSYNVQLPSQVINSRRVGTVGNSSVFTYPSDLGVHFMLFQFKSYNRLSDNSNQVQIIQSVALPMPTSLKEDYQATYDSEDLGIFGAIAESPAIQNIINNPSMSNLEALGPAIAGLASGDNKKALLSQIVRQALNGTKLGDAVEQYNAQILNPHLVTAFRGVPLREHSFSWRIAPESAKDAATFNSIRKIFRSNMSPTTGFGRTFLNYPNMVDISIGGIQTTENGYSMPFKTCVITRCALNRNPTGYNAFFKGTGSSVVMDFEVQLKEIEAFTREDFEPSQPADPNVIGVNGGTSGA